MAADVNSESGTGVIGANTRRVTIATDDAVSAALLAAVDGIEGSNDGVETLLTAIDGHVDGLEAKDFATQVTLAAVLANQPRAASLGHGVTTVTTAGTDVALAASTACRWVIVQNQTDNTSLIAVGATGVDATVATGTGVVLYPGDSIRIEVDNLADVFIDSLVNGEGVRYTYGV